MLCHFVNRGFTWASKRFSHFWFHSQNFTPAQRLVPGIYGSITGGVIFSCCAAPQLRTAVTACLLRSHILLIDRSAQEWTFHFMAVDTAIVASVLISITLAITMRRNPAVFSQNLLLQPKLFFYQLSTEQMRNEKANTKCAQPPLCKFSLKSTVTIPKDEIQISATTGILTKLSRTRPRTITGTFLPQISQEFILAKIMNQRPASCIRQQK